MGSPGSNATEAVLAELYARPAVPPLEPGEKVYNSELIERIKGLEEHKYTVAAIHLLNDDIHNAHLIAQDNEGDPTADLLHATLHRREGDYWNSKYWWSHVRSHPTITSSADAKAFVDACEAVKRQQGPRGGGGGGGRRGGGGGGGGKGDGGNGDGENDGSAKEMELRERQWDELKRLVEWTRANCT